VEIEQSARNGCVVLTLTGRLDLGAAPVVQRALLKSLNEEPTAIICDLAGVPSIDPLCAGTFSAVRHPALGWPGTTLILCDAVPAVAALLAKLHAPRRLPMYDSVEAALARSRVRPPYLVARLALLPAPTSAAAARAFVRQHCSRWGLGDLVDVATLLTSELVTNAIVHAATPIELRLELQEPHLNIVVHDHDPRAVRALRAGQSEHQRGLLIVDSVAKAWGIRQDPAGGKLIWCALPVPAAPPVRGRPAPGAPRA
jgi:anti-anti-sigma regulatory factor/anti-sigma regulatory factor (Ser/Thr protein kinase)